MHRFIALLFLLATVLPLGYLLYVFTNFEWLVEQEWFYESWRTQAFAVYSFILTVIYCWLAHKNESIPKESKANWYVGFIVAAPLVGAYYWVKKVWPSVNK